MALTDRRIRCEISKTVQERQFEPLKVNIALEGTVSDEADLQEELDAMTEFIEEAVLEQLNSMLT